MDEENWVELKNTEKYQARAWMNRRDGRVISLEPVGPTAFDVNILPENFQQDNQVIRSHGRHENYEQALEKVQEIQAEA